MKYYHIFQWFFKEHFKKKMSHFYLKSWVSGGTKIRPGIPSNWRIFESNWLDIERQFDSYILQLLGIPGRILLPPVTQLFRSKWLIFFFQWKGNWELLVMILIEPDNIFNFTWHACAAAAVSSSYRTFLRTNCVLCSLLRPSLSSGDFRSFLRRE